MFHRYSTPSYAGGLRPGDDYLNNADAGTPSPADGQLAAGVNSGSYFYGTSEQFTVAAINRGLRALGENCDDLDDRLVQMALDYAEADAVVEADFAAADAVLATSITTVSNNLADEVAYRTRERTTVASVASFPHNLTADENLVCLSGAGGTINLPDPATCVGRKFFMYIDAGTTGATFTLDSNASSTPGGPKFLNLPGTGSEGAMIKAMAGFPYALYAVSNPDCQLEFFTPDGANWLVTAHKGTP